MTLTDMMKDLVKRGCYPCCSYRGGGVYRAHINGAGNRWGEGRTPDNAMREAFDAWRRDGFPMDGYACTGNPSTPDNAPALADGRSDDFDPCCGKPPKVTEWRPGCYGAQCMECGGIVGDERQLDEDELREAWNRAMRKRAIAKAGGEA